MQFVVLSSSHGTTFQAIIDSLKDGSLTATCLGLIADREARGCVEKAKQAGLPVKIVQKNPGEDRETYDRRLHKTILSLGLPSSVGGGAGGGGVIAATGWMLFLPGKTGSSTCIHLSSRNTREHTLMKRCLQLAKRNLE